MKRGLFEKAALGRHGKNDIYLGTVNVQTVVSYFADLHQTGIEAKRVMGSRPRGPVTAADIDTMRALAQRVRESYGEAAVGALPSLETKQEAV